jgi:hypothetical protein
MHHPFQPWGVDEIVNLQTVFWSAISEKESDFKDEISNVLATGHVVKKQKTPDQNVVQFTHECYLSKSSLNHHF